MGDISVIVRGKDSVENRDSYYSTVHGAGRIMSRTQAAGKMNWKTRTRSGGQITDVQMKEAVRNYGVELRGAGTDESPFVYRKLREVLDAHSETVEVMHVLKPIGVCMAVPMSLTRIRINEKRRKNGAVPIKKTMPGRSVHSPSIIFKVHICVYNRRNSWLDVLVEQL